MARAEISRGLLYGGYEPHDMPGAYIVVTYAVLDALGETPPERIGWSGPCTWLDSRDGVPEGYKALWLGAPEAARPLIVWVANEPTAESGEYEAGYRRGWKAKRRPVISPKASSFLADGIRDGWRVRKNL